MEITNRVQHSTNLVADFERLPERGWTALRNHRHRDAFMREYMVAKCVTDLWYFMRFGVYTRAMKHYYEPLHGPQGLSGYLQDWSRTDAYGQKSSVGVKFVIMNREDCKTQTAIAWDAWQFVRDVNARLLVRAYTDDKAREILAGVKELLESPQFRRNFPWVRPKQKKNSTHPELWTIDQIRLARDDVGVRVPSAEACGIGSDPTGGHFTLAHYDDFEVKANANSEALILQMISTWQNDSNLFMAGAKRVFCCTPWGRKGIVLQVKDRKGEFANHGYDTFVHPAEIRVFEKPFSGEEPILLGDRLTVRDINAGFPTIEANLSLCQARVRFFSEAARAYVDEIREIEWNDGTQFRVNRPFPEMLGQSVSYTIGTVKPGDPNRFTLDSVDVQPVDVDRLIRKSLVEKKREQGSAVYSAQMLLDPVDPEGMLLNPELLQEVKVDPDPLAPEKVLPEGPKEWYRACDFASDKKGTASTAITTGFFHQTGLYITHIAHERQMSDTDKILELMMGTLRVQNLKGHIRATFFEKAAIENTLDKFLAQAERDPYAYFTALGGKYAQHAEKLFKDIGPIRIPRELLGRQSNLSKTMRISSQQPLWEARQVFVVVGPGFVDYSAFEALQDEARYFNLSSDDSFDILDTMHDLIDKGRKPIQQSEARRSEGLFTQSNRQAALRNALASYKVAAIAWPPRS